MSPILHFLRFSQPPSPSQFSTFWWIKARGAVNLESHFTDEMTCTPRSSEACSTRLWGCFHELSVHSTTIMEPALRASAAPRPRHPFQRARSVMNSSSARRTVLAAEKVHPAGVSVHSPAKGWSCPSGGQGAQPCLHAAARRLSARPAVGRGPAPPARPRPPAEPTLGPLTMFAGNSRSPSFFFLPLLSLLSLFLSPGFPRP